MNARAVADVNRDLSAGEIIGRRVDSAPKAPLKAARHTPWNDPLIGGGVAEWLKAAVC
jgi:hypothetical protein